ncbi:MAG TPA: DUF4136 domain-containing protein [Candidatus Angelobacter sp.]
MKRWDYRSLRALTVVIFLSGPIWGQKISTGYDKTADFSQFKTYAWVERDTPATDPVLAALIVADIDSELGKKGLRKVESNPDLLVTCYGGLGSQSVFAAEDPGYAAMGGAALPGTNMWGGSASSAPVAQVVQGTLVVDLVDARQKHLVWRATAKANLDYDKRSKLFDQANKAVAAIFRKYPPGK